MPEKFSNDATTTLNGAINNSVTSLIVTSATLFPAAGNFRIRIDDEIMLVTAVSGTTYTVTRGVEGTTAVSHLTLATIRHVLTAAAVTQGAADAAGGVAWTLVTKTADEDISSNTTLQDDDHLFTPALTNGKLYEFEMLLMTKNPVTTGGNLKMAVGEDSTVRGTYQGLGTNTSGNAAAAQNQVTLAQQQTWQTVSTTTDVIKLWGLFVSGGAAFKLQWTQSASSANVVRMLAGSLLRYRQVN